MKSKEKIYTASEAANILRVSMPTMYKILQKERIRSARVGSDYRIAESSIRDFLNGVGASGTVPVQGQAA